jgi:transposase InsO family protein
MDKDSAAERWARLRFAIIGPLLAAPPKYGELQQAFRQLADSLWRHPIHGTDYRISVGSIERWYYKAHRAVDPVAALRPQRREDAGRTRRLSAALVAQIERQYQQHSDWTMQLHYDNLVALSESIPELQPMPSYSTLRRHLKARGLHRQRLAPPQRPGEQRARERLERREVRSYEAEYVNALWHADYHHGSVPIVTRDGRWVKPILLGILDDRSRLACHVQWYLDETAESLVHGLSQAFQRRSLPRSLMTDNGSAMKSAEFLAGLHALGIVFDPTLPYSPFQNGKQETFWGSVEGRLLAMLKGVRDLTLERLNELTLIWVEQDYHRRVHREISATPLDRYLNDPDVGRVSPGSESLRQVFRRTQRRTQRRSDATLMLCGKRWEIPNRYRHLDKPLVRYATWDLSAVDLLDPNTGHVLCALYPLDKQANASGARRTLAQSTTDSSAQMPDAQDESGELPPLMKKLVAEFAATGLPPSYIPKPPKDKKDQ